MEAYLLKSSVALAVFYVLYRFVLFHRFTHQTKRAVGLFVVCFCTLLPLFPPLNLQQTLDVPPNMSSFLAKGSEIATDTVQFSETKTNIFLIVYQTGFILFGLRFFYGFSSLFLLLRKATFSKKWGFTIAKVNQSISPFSFFNMLFLGKEEACEPIIFHEQYHRDQFHSFDVIFLEAINVLFWFNPFMWLIKKDIKASHEFLADGFVINKGIDPLEYQDLLFKARTGVLYTSVNYLSNQTGLKQRFNVMKKSKINPKTNFFSLSVVLIAVLITISISSYSQEDMLTSSSRLKVIVLTEKGEVPLKEGISENTEHLILKIIPNDEKIATRVTKAELTLVSGGKGRASALFEEKFELEPIRSAMKKNAQLVIEILEYQTKDEHNVVSTITKENEAFNATRFINISIR